MDRERLIGHKLNNLLHSLLLLGGLAALAGLLGWIIAGGAGLLWTAVAAALVMLLGPRISPRVLLRMYGARAVDPAEARGLYALTAELAARAGLRDLPRLWYLPSRILAAFTVGRPQDAHVVVSDGLLRALDTRELAGVLAHELSHVRNNDMWIMGLADAVSRLTGMLAFVGQILLIISLPFYLYGGGLPVIPLLLLILSPTASALLQLALSRTREFDADLDAAAITADPGGLASALAKLERMQRGWFERVFLPGSRLPEPSLLRTHPATEERVRRLMSLAPGSPYRQGAYAARHDADRFSLVSRGPRWHVGGLWY